MIRRPIVLIIAAAAVVAGCSGVPHNSAPHMISKVAGGVAPAPAPVVTPPPGADPYEIVTGFLAANASEDAHHTAARNYLTEPAAAKWVDTFATVVSTLPIGLPDPVTHAVTVITTKLGQLDSTGAYRPVTNSGTPLKVVFQMAQVAGQWRISTSPATGLLIDEAEFAQTYKPHPIYFLNQSQRGLIPDLRYSPLDAQTLCNWLLDQLTAGPPQDLASANTAVPDQGPHPSVTFGQSSIVVDIPGALELDAQTRARMAAQLAYTFSLNLSEFDSQAVSLVDGAKPVPVPSVPNPFSPQNFLSYAPGVSGPSPVYYVRNGAIVDHSGNAVVGPAGNASAELNTIAIAHRGSSMLLAATRGKPDHEQLVLGQLTGAMHQTDVSGPLTRPAFVPGLSEVWIGDGSKLLRIASNGTSATPVTLAQSSGSVSGQIKSVAFSPDGALIALVIASGGSSQVWIGTINRETAASSGSAAVSIENLQPITPTGILLTDVAWNDESTLYTVGQFAPPTGRFGIWSVQEDGSLLTMRPISNLPAQPDSITASQYGFTWVSVLTTVWEQAGPDNAWTAPGGSLGTTLGSNPTYVE